MRGRGRRLRWRIGLLGRVGFAVAVAVAVVVVVVGGGLVVGRKGLLMRRAVRAGRRRCLWVVLLDRRRVLVLCQMGFVVRRVVRVGRKQIEMGRRMGLLVAEERCSTRLRRGWIVAESDRLLQWRKD